MKTPKKPLFVLLSGNAELIATPYPTERVAYENTTDYAIVVTGAVLRYPGHVDVPIPTRNMSNRTMNPGDRFILDFLEI